jgi:hypothetical protein
MRRRELMLLLGGGAILNGADGRAQEPGRIYRLGVMHRGPREGVDFVALLDELRQSGFVEGQNLRVEGRFSMRDEDASKVAMELVAAGVDAISTGSYHRTRAVQKATRTIPIVSVADDLVLSGLVSSLAHPGGNTTGISILATELDGKRQDLLIELIPSARRIAALANPGDTAPEQLRVLEDAARERGIELSTRTASTPEEIVAALDAAKAGGAQAQCPGIGIVQPQPAGDHRAHKHAPASCDISVARNRRSWWAGGLRPALCGDLSATGRTTACQNFSGIQARRHPGRAAGQIRADYQSQDREGHRPGPAAIDTRPRRRGHRVMP